MTLMTMSPFNQKLWDDAKLAISKANYGVFTDYEREFCDGINNREKVLAEAGLPFRPTVKQFNFLRELARKVA